MIRAEITLADGGVIVIETHGDDYNELFKRLDGLEMKALYAEKIKPKEMRQGKM